MSVELDNKLKADIIINSDLPLEAKSMGAMGALLGVDNESIIHSMVDVMSFREGEKLEKQFPKQKKPRKLTKTESVIHDMLTENTGAHMLDSGGAYGRMWEKNRSIKDFRDIPQIRVTTNEWDKKEFTLHRSLFHLLNDHLTFDADMNYRFNRFCKSKDQKDNYWSMSIADFIEKKLEVKTIIEEYTYNLETNLDQDFCFTIFADHDDKVYAIIQTHNGCDARGGFSTPKVFRLNDDWENLVVKLRDVYADCDCFEINSDDAGYHWYSGSVDGFPKEWNVSTRLNGVYCRDCKKEVVFS